MVTYIGGKKVEEKKEPTLDFSKIDLTGQGNFGSVPITPTVNKPIIPVKTISDNTVVNPYQLTPAELADPNGMATYNARIAAMRGETTPPATIGSSSTIRNDELKKQADQIKADNEKTAELKRVATQAEIDRIKSTTAPAGGAPPAVSGVKTFEDLYQGQAMPAAQEEITVIKDEEQTVIDELNSYKRKLSGIAGGTTSIFEGKEGEAARIAQDRLDVLQRRETLLTDRYNTKLNYIKTIATLTQQDYTISKKAYDDEYNRNFQIYQQYSTEKDRDVSAARASLQTILNTTKDSGVSLKDAIAKNPLLGLQINEMETTLGYAEGTFSALATSNPIGKMLFNSLSEDKSQAFVAFQQPDGSIKTMVVNTGMAGAGGNKAQIAEDQAQTQLINLNTIENHPGLDSRVGPNALSRGLFSVQDRFGAGQDFAGQVHKMVSGLSLQSLIEAKARGATFGALSDAEMRILANSATAISDWETKDKNGVGEGVWNIDEESFKTEIDVIRNLTQAAINRTNNIPGSIAPDDLIEIQNIYNSSASFNPANYYK